MPKVVLSKRRSGESNIVDNDVRRLMRRGGVPRMAKSVPPAMRRCIIADLHRILGVAVPIVAASKGCTLTVEDVKIAYQHTGKKLTM